MKIFTLPPAKEVDSKQINFQLIWEQLIYPLSFWRDSSKTKLGRSIDDKIEGKEPETKIELTDGEHEALSQAMALCPTITNAPVNRYFNLCLEHIQDSITKKE